MNILTATVREIFEEDGVRYGWVVVDGARTRACLGLLPDAKIGDVVLVHAGVALAALGENEKGEADVLGYSG